jgi:hypothetical protein
VSAEPLIDDDQVLARILAYLRSHGHTSAQNKVKGSTIGRALDLGAAEFNDAFQGGYCPDGVLKADDPDGGVYLDDEDILVFDDDVCFWTEPEREEPARNTGTVKESRTDAPKRKGKLGYSYAPVPRAIIKDAGLSLSARVAAAVLADALNLNKNARQVIKLSFRALAERMGVDLSTARTAIAELRDHGYLAVDPGKGHGTNRYRFTGLDGKDEL